MLAVVIEMLTDKQVKCTIRDINNKPLEVNQQHFNNLGSFLLNKSESEGDDFILSVKQIDREDKTLLTPTLNLPKSK